MKVDMLVEDGYQSKVVFTIIYNIKIYEFNYCNTSDTMYPKTK